MRDKKIYQWGQYFTFGGEGSKFTSVITGEEHTEKIPEANRTDVISHNLEAHNNHNSAIKNSSNGNLKDHGFSNSSLIIDSSSHLKDQSYGNLKDHDFSNSSAQPLELHLEEYRTSYRSSSVKEIESADTELPNESDLEVTEFDVEGVLQKQNTHDLYCPNCNSCITRRVILRKRKRRIRISGEDVKRNKIPTVDDSHASTELGASDRTHDTADVSLDGTGIAEADDHTRDRDPEAFRCLSCFSIFIPTGNGFKLFGKFGQKGKKDSVQDEQITTVNKNWFISFFSSSKEKTSIEQARDNMGEAPQFSKLSSKNGQSSTTQEVLSGDHITGTLVDSGTMGGQEDGAKPLYSPTQDAAVHGKVMIDTRDESQNALKAQKGYAAYDSKKELFLDDEIIDNARKTPAEVTKGESVETSISANQRDGLKLLIPSSRGTHDKQQTDQKTNLATQKALADSVFDLSGSGAVLSLPATVSPIEGPGTDPKVDISFDIPHKKSQYVESTILAESTVGKKNSELSIKDNGEDTAIDIEAEPEASQRTPEETVTSPLLSTQNRQGQHERTDVGEGYGIDIIKSIVYGGLAESIASLSVVSSSAGSDASTLNILALGLANLIGGLFVIAQNLWDLKHEKIEHVSNRINEAIAEDRYQELLGRRANFLLHATVAIVSYLIFGLLPPVIYGFSFRKSDDRELKLLMVAATSLICILVLSAGKAYVKRPPKSYIKTIIYYVVMGFMVSGVSFVAGVYIKKLLEKLGLFPSTSAFSLLPETTPTTPKWAFY